MTTTPLPEIPFSSFKSASEFTAWCESNSSDKLSDHLQELYNEEHPHRWLICAHDEQIAGWPLTEQLLKKAKAIDLEDEDGVAYDAFYDSYRAWILEVFGYHTGLKDAAIIDELEFDFDADGKLEAIGELTIAVATLDDATLWVTRTDHWDSDGITFEMTKDVRESALSLSFFAESDGQRERADLSFGVFAPQ